MSKHNDPYKGYPITPRKGAKGSIEVLDGVDIYKFQNQDKTDGRWQAVLFVKSTYPKYSNPDEMQTTVSVRIYSWRYGERRTYRGRDDLDAPIYESTGEMYWREVNSTPINKQSIWGRLKAAIEKYVGELPE